MIKALLRWLTNIEPLAVTQTNEDIILLFIRRRLFISRLCIARSLDGATFEKAHPITITTRAGLTEKIKHCRDFTLSYIINNSHETYTLTYIRDDKNGPSLTIASSLNLINWTITARPKDITERAVIVPNYQHQEEYTLYYGEIFTRLAFSRDLHNWYKTGQLLLTPRAHLFDGAGIKVISVKHEVDGKLFLTYESTRRDENGEHLTLGGARIDGNRPDTIEWRSDDPLLTEDFPVGTDVKSLGTISREDSLLYYITDHKHNIQVVALPHPLHRSEPNYPTARLEKFMNNPIIGPTDNVWEAEATFNPAVVTDEGKVHLFYRAIGPHGFSTVGYANSRDGFSVDEREPNAVYWPREEFEGVHTKPTVASDLFASGGGWGGCEDPKVTIIDDNLYMTYVAYNGYSHPRAAITSLSLADFRARRWNWSPAKLISRPNVVTKSVSILPEKIRDKYVLFHRVFPHIQIDYRDSLEFGEDDWLKTEELITTRPSFWDSRKLSVGATPMKIDDGWLVIYHAVDDRDPQYRYCIGAMVLDHDNPSRVLYRSSVPALVPEHYFYENEGKAGIAYPSGAAIVGNDLLVYYGGGDKYVCIAHAPLQKFLSDLKNDIQTVFSFNPVSLRNI